MIARGLGVGEVPAERSELYATLTSSKSIPALSYDLTFPEVFHPSGDPNERQGFHAVLGNPPWDAILFKSKEFFAAFDFEILSAPTKRERERIEKRLVADPVCGSLFEHYKEEFEQQKRANDSLYEYQKVYIEGDLAGRQADAFRIFMERNTQLLAGSGWTGIVVPSAFHANEGATGIRQLYLEKLSILHCYSFENRRKLFEIHSSFKFATVVAQAGKRTDQFYCRFYLHDDEWLFGSKESMGALIYSVDFVKRTSGAYLSFVELRDLAGVSLSDTLFKGGKVFGKYCEEKGIRLQTQPVTLHMSKDAHRFQKVTKFIQGGGDPRLPELRQSLLKEGVFYLAEGKTFHQFDETWGDRPAYCVSISNLDRNPLWTEAGRYFRLAFRAIASSTNERTSIFCVISPGAVFGNSAAVERSPNLTPRSEVLVLSALCNTFPFDWALRIMTSSNVNLFIMNNAPICPTETIRDFLTHGALRLTCNHFGYGPLWKEQLGEAWRENGKEPQTWPVLVGEKERWGVRAAIDAVVAQAYGLSREQYRQILSTFSHTSYKKAPEHCLESFDELKRIGFQAFAKKHDPYWDVPLSETLSKPVIELPIYEEVQASLLVP